MMNQGLQKYGGVVILIVAIAGGFFLLSGKNVNAPTENIDTEIPGITDPVVEKPTTKSGGKVINVPPPSDVVLTEAQQALFSEELKFAKARDYENFAIALGKVYKNEWAGIPNFLKIESEFYVYTYNTYWLKGDLANALKYSTIVYNKVPEAWRFRYIRVLALEKYGRNAYNAGDLAKAEEYAQTMLQMMFRPEGANLMGDIYISKIKTAIKDGNKNLAKQNFEYIWDYEVSTDRRATLNTLKPQIESLP